MLRQILQLQSYNHEHRYRGGPTKSPNLSVRRDNRLVLDIECSYYYYLVRK